jgi:hypothetical protein
MKTSVNHALLSISENSKMEFIAFAWKATLKTN